MYMYIYTKALEADSQILVYQVQSSIIRNNQNVEATQVSTDRHMNKPNVAYTYIQ